MGDGWDDDGDEFDGRGSMGSQGILLESGTNEVEVLEFYLGAQSFGVNVAKVLRLIPFDRSRLVVTPDADGELLGAIPWEEGTIPLMNLSAVLGRPRNAGEDDRAIVIITQFNAVTNAWLTDGVNRIHRISWVDLHPASDFIARFSSVVIGSVKPEEREILLVDFEYLVARFQPETSIESRTSEIPRPEANIRTERAKPRILVAEDSPFIRDGIRGYLNQAGYDNLELFENGEDAYQSLVELKQRGRGTGKALHEMVDVLVTDIEMPRLDGLTLCRRLKEELGGESIPVIVLSSLINEQMAAKCQDVGADQYITKPEITRLVPILDRLLLGSVLPESAVLIGR